MYDRGIESDSQGVLSMKGPVLRYSAKQAWGISPVPKIEGPQEMTTKTESDVVNTAGTAQERGPKVAGRVTVNLSRKSVEALDAAGELTDATKTEVINKAVQLFKEIQEAQSSGGGVWIQTARDSEPVLVRYY